MQIRHQILFTVGHLDALETWRCWRFLSVSFLASSLLFHSPAINTRLVWHSARHFLAYLTMFCSLCWDLIGCAQACASSVRISPLRMETLHSAVDICGRQHITGPCLKWICINEETVGCLVMQVETTDSLPAIRTLFLLLQTSTTRQSPS